jgi:AbrB family looped-hinge helix DNA binding protein
MINTIRVQEKGQVTIPRDIRRKLNLKKGDLVTFVSTDAGIVIKPLELASNDLLDDLKKRLQARNLHLETLLERAQQTNAETLAREFSLSEVEKKILYQALQLKAQAAVEAIRSIAAITGSADINEEDINIEIQKTRK